MSPLKIAHRGLCKKAPENSLQAFLEAQSGRVEGVELDLQWHPEGKIFALHDDTLARTHGIHQELRDLPLATINELHKPFALPTLNEILEQASNQVLHLEIKIPDSHFSKPLDLNCFLEQMVSELKNHPLPLGSTLASFQPEVLKILNHQKLNLPLTGIAESRLQLACMEKLTFLDYLSIAPSLIPFAQRPESQMWIWGVTEIQTIEALGHDWIGVISDHFPAN